MRGACSLVLALLAGAFVASSTHAVTMDWVTVGSPGNADDDTGFGAVAASYRISKYEVTVGQYTAFLNAAAQSDPHGLFVTEMQLWQGVTRSGSDGSYTYAVSPGREDRAMGHVQLANALRFSNWMHNGQGLGDTETGAYTISTTDYADGSIQRNIDAAVFLPSESEWYKAAYFDALTTNYFEYPTSSNSPGTCSTPTAAANHANCGGVMGSPENANTPVGSYSGTSSPFGTYDQGGNVWEWNEAWLTGETGGLRGGGGGSNQATGPFGDMRASYRGGGSPSTGPDQLDIAFGFRLAASVPEPSTALLFTLGFIGLSSVNRRRRVSR